MRVAMREVRLTRISAAASAMNSTPAGTWRTTCAPAAASSVSSSVSSPRGQVAKWLAGGSAARSGRTGCCVLVRRDSGFKLGFQKHLSAKDAKNREVKNQYFLRFSSPTFASFADEKKVKTASPPPA